MSVARSEVLAQARTWMGTRWVHQGRTKGSGVDCAGLVIGVAHELGLVEAQVDGYGRIPDGIELLGHCRRYMQPIPAHEALPADVLVFSFVRAPQHLAFLSEFDGQATLIHSYGEVEKVVENGFDAVWRRRLRAAFRIPGVA